MVVAKPSIDALEEVRNYIFNIDFSQIIDKMVSHQKWRRFEANKACNFYRNFLYLNAKYPEYCPLPPSQDIDEFWHNHILDTKKYFEDTQAIFGRYFHHYPYLGIDANSNMKDLNRYFEKTQALHFQEFGEYIYTIRRNVLISWILKLVDQKQQGAQYVGTVKET